VKPSLLRLGLLSCPECGKGLALSATHRDGDEVMEGALTCKGCRRSFPILRGVPRLLPDSLMEESRKTAEQFGYQWERFDKLDAIYEQQFLDWIAPVGRDFFEGKVVLEGGCGKGRHTDVAARFGAKAVVAVDLSVAVDVAFRNCRHLPNVHVVQADINRLPLLRAFDYAFSVGVLHHLPDPRKGFLSLASKVKKGGSASVWVYGAEGNEWITNYLDPIRTRVTSRMPKGVLYPLAGLLTVPLWTATKLVYGPVAKIGPLSPLKRVLFYFDYLAYISKLSFRDQYNIVFDHLIPPVAFYHRRDEIEEWFRSAGSKNAQLFWHNKNSWRGFGRI